MKVYLYFFTTINFTNDIENGATAKSFNAEIYMGLIKVSNLYLYTQSSYIYDINITVNTVFTEDANYASFFDNNMGLTDTEVADLLHGYNPSNPFTNWSNARINKSIDLLQRQRLASGYMNPENAAQSVGVGKLPALKRFTYQETNPLKYLSEQAKNNLKSYTDKQLIENGSDWLDETIAKGKWQDVGMEMRGSMKQMGFDPTNEQDVLRFVQRFKAQQLGQKLNQYSGKPDIETLFGGINKNKNGGLLKFTNGGNVNIGQEMTVTPRQLEELKRQGYKIQML
jgi:hypothetical protein